VTIDGETTAQGTVTVRHRDSMLQERVVLDRVAEYVTERLGQD
jgi:glycyl-tRNA synthetase (class II)